MVASTLILLLVAIGLTVLSIRMGECQMTQRQAAVDQTADKRVRR